MLVMAGTQLAPIVSEARTLGQFGCAGASATLRAGAQPLVELGQRYDDALPRARPGPVARVRPQPDRAPAADPDRGARGTGAAARSSTAGSTTPIAACRSTSSRNTPGARATPACCGRGPSPTSPPSSAFTSRCRSTRAASASSRAITSRARRTSASRWSGVGLYYDQGYFKQRLDLDGRQHEDYLDVDSGLLPIQPATRDGEPITVSIDTRTGTIAARVWSLVGRPQHAAPARLERRRQPAGGPRADCAPVRRRRSRPHPPGAAARRRRRPRAAGDGHLPRRRAPQRRPQRLCRAGADAPSHGQRGDRRVGGDPPRLIADRLHDAHAGAGRPRSLLAGSRRRAPWTAARSAPSWIRRPDGARPGQHRATVAKRSA